MYLVARALGGSASFATTRRAIAFASAPAVFSALPVAGIVAHLWSWVIRILAVSLVHRISRGRALLAFAGPLAVSTSVELLVRKAFVDTYRIPSRSMEPTLKAYDVFLATKTPPRWFIQRCPLAATSSCSTIEDQPEKKLLVRS